MRTALLLPFMFFAIAMAAQQAPNFTVTDTYSQEHTLYEDYLDQDRVVLLGLFFTDCILCDELLPLVQEHYQQSWSMEYPLDIILLSGVDADTSLNQYAYLHNINLTMAGFEGDAWEAMMPYMEDNSWGTFYGYPMFVVIGPGGEVIYDPWGDTLPETVSDIQDAIDELSDGIVSVDDINNNSGFDWSINSNEVQVQSILPGNTLKVYSVTGQLLAEEQFDSNIIWTPTTPNSLFIISVQNEYGSEVKKWASQ
ncbi:MAG: hypothetical protein AAF193_04420 [Bacteroidota bacterium]